MEKLSCQKIVALSGNVTGNAALETLFSQLETQRRKRRLSVNTLRFYGSYKISRLTMASINQELLC
jgi:hypothetical protein